MRLVSLLAFAFGFALLSDAMADDGLVTLRITLIADRDGALGGTEIEGASVGDLSALRKQLTELGRSESTQYQAVMLEVDPTLKHATVGQAVNGCRAALERKGSRALSVSLVLTKKNNPAKSVATLDERATVRVGDVLSLTIRRGGIEASGKANIADEIAKEAKTSAALAVKRNPEFKLGNDLPTTVILTFDGELCFGDCHAVIKECQKQGFYKFKLRQLAEEKRP